MCVVQPDRFMVFMANVVQAIVASGLFVRETTLAIKPGKLGDA